MVPESADLADDEARRFVEVLLKSGLVLPPDVVRLIRDFCRECSEVSARSAANFSTFLVSNAVLTLWQADRLREGRFRGFFMGRYLLLDPIGENQSLPLGVSGP